MTSDTYRIVLSYSHADEPLKRELEAHLAPLRLLSRIEAWSDRRMKVGTYLFQEIKQTLDDATGIIMLTSPAYLSSSACVEEMQVALARHEAGSSRAIPV